MSKLYVTGSVTSRSSLIIRSPLIRLILFARGTPRSRSRDPLRLHFDYTSQNVLFEYVVSAKRCCSSRSRGRTRWKRRVPFFRRQRAESTLCISVVLCFTLFPSRLSRYPRTFARAFCSYYRRSGEKEGCTDGNPYSRGIANHSGWTLSLTLVSISIYRPDIGESVTSENVSA